jgi:dolichol-phosphate mannosyltransferase
MKYRALKKNLRVVETPIVFVDRRVGQSKMSRAIFVEALLKVWSLRFRRW